VVGLALGAGMAILTRKKRMTNGESPMTNQARRTKPECLNMAVAMTGCDVGKVTQVR
jgi:hypothetical protein